MLGGGLSVAALAPVACAAEPLPTLARARRDGVLRIGISGERPFCYLGGDGQVTGSSPEVARAVLAGMGIGGIEAVQLPFDRLIPGLRAAQFDLVAAGMAIDPQRCTQVAFSRPDFIAPPALLVRQGNPHRLRSLADVRRAGLRLAVLAGSVELGYARAAGIDDAQLEVVDDQRHLFQAVIDHRADVGVLTAISLRDELRRNPGTGLEVTGPIVAQTRGRRIVPAGGFALRLEDRDLLAGFDAGLAALQADGRWLAITAPFGFTADNVPPQEITTESLCAG